jgi:GLPGLI family protein
MKKYLVFALFLTNFLAVSAQTASTTEGVIIFEEKINLHRRITDEQMKAMVPEFRSSKMELYFKGDECLYKAPEEDDDEQEMRGGGGGGGMRMRFGRPSSEIYRNFATEKRVEQRDAMGKKYLVEDTLRVIAWKLGTDTKKILNYDCVKATFEDTARKQKITAWFTESLALTAGPANFGSLPGMILGVDVNNGEMQFTALKIDFKTVKAEDIKAPSKGEKITDAAYRKKMEEMFQRNGGGNGTFRIQRN